ncbi:MAG: hypothetical protein AAB567_02590 [Patescibacteria group bacterium]
MRIRSFLIFVFVPFVFLWGFDVTAKEPEFIEGDYARIGEVVQISGIVEGDVYAVGSQILVDGEIRGDLLAVGAAVSISGKVVQDVRVVGSQIVVKGEVGRNITVAGMNVEVTDSAKIHGGLTGTGVNVVVLGPIGRNVKVSGRNLTIGSSIGGNVKAAVENVRLNSNANIQGNLTYWSNKKAVVDPDAILKGTLVQKSSQELFSPFEKFLGPFFRFVKTVLWVGDLLATLVIGLLLISFARNYSAHTLGLLRRQPFRCIKVGILVGLAAPLLSGFLILTIVGIPIGILLLTISWLFFFAARVFVIWWMGVFLLERLGKKARELVVFGAGLILYVLIGLIPILGVFISFFAMIWGAGAAAIAFKEMRKNI